VLASGSRHSNGTRHADNPDPYLFEPKPSFGFYLDKDWLWKLTAVAGVGIDLTNESSFYDWPFMVVKWPDMGTLSTEDTTNIIDFLARKLEANEAVEIACIGGHGRTGCLLAMMRVKIGGMGAKEAIESLRKDYCEDAVESKGQVEAIYKVAGEKYVEDDAPAPAKVWGGGWGSYNVSKDCENCDHSNWSHERVMEKFKDDPEVRQGRRACAWKKFNDGDDWDCACNKWVEKKSKPKNAAAAKAKATNSTSTSSFQGKSRQSQFEELAGSQQDGAAFQRELAGIGKDEYSMPTQEELDDETKLWQYLCRDFGGDMCACYHMRADHPSRSDPCNLCSCSQWELSYQDGDGFTQDVGSMEGGMT